MRWTLRGSGRRAIFGLAAAAMMALSPGPGTAQDLRAGLSALATEDYAVAHRILLPLAEAGDAGAQYELAKLYDFGRGVEIDFAIAAEWYRRAAEQGHVRARAEYGIMLLFGDGVERDQHLGWKWVSVAAAAGDAAALETLGWMYETGTLVELDPAEAARFYAQAADLGFATAQRSLAYLHLEGSGVPLDEARARTLFLSAAEQGDLPSAYEAALMLAFGEGGPINYDGAIDLLHQAADGGHVDAQYELGLHYFYEFVGNDDPVDEDLAHHYFRLAADQGHSGARDMQVELDILFMERYFAATAGTAQTSEPAAPAQPSQAEAAASERQAMMDVIGRFRFPDTYCPTPAMPPPYATDSEVRWANEAVRDWVDCLDWAYDRDFDAYLQLFVDLGGSWESTGGGNYTTTLPGLCDCRDATDSVRRMMEERADTRDRAILEMDSAIAAYNRQVDSDAAWREFNDALSWEMETFFQPPQWNWSPQPYVIPGFN